MTADAAYNQQIPTEEIDTGLWGEMESESEEEESEDEDEEEEEGEGEEGGEGGLPSGAQTPVVGEPGMATPSGMSSVGGIGQETPELLELRKKKIEAEMEGGETPNLYTGTITVSFIVNRLPKFAGHLRLHSVCVACKSDQSQSKFDSFGGWLSTIKLLNK